MSDWQPVTPALAVELADARLQAHWAAQAVEAGANALLPRQADDGQSNMSWSPASRALISRELEVLERKIHAGLRIEDLTLLILDSPETAVVDEFALDGRTLGEAMQWVGGAVGATLAFRDYEVPDHAVHHGDPFRASAEALSELARWYSNASLMLGELQEREARASELRCWPHHFDIATLLTERQEPGGEATQTIGVGLSPGDGSYPEPYWYTGLWPTPDDPSLPALDGKGVWHTEGWVGAVLPASRLESGPEQEEQVRSFLTSAVAGSREIQAAAGRTEA